MIYIYICIGETLLRENSFVTAEFKRYKSPGIYQIRAKTVQVRVKHHAVKSTNYSSYYDISFLTAGAAEDFGNLGYDIASLRNQIPASRGSIVPNRTFKKRT